MKMLTFLVGILSLSIACQTTGLDPAVISRAEIDPVNPWVRHDIYTNSTLRGADGIDKFLLPDGSLLVASAWEESGRVTVSKLPSPGGTWQTVVLGTGNSLAGAEDAILADMDADGAVDVVVACECKKVAVFFAPTDPTQFTNVAAWSTPVFMPGATINRWIKVAVSDVDNDGRPDIIGGGKTSPAKIGWWRAPANPRVAAGWSFSPIGPVSWTMSLEPKDVNDDGRIDVVVSDKDYIHAPVIDYTLNGTRWIEQNSDGSWTNHKIGHLAGHSSVFIEIIDWDHDGDDDVIEASYSGSVNTVTFWENSGDWLTWTSHALPMTTDNVGMIQDVAVGDLDGDGEYDLVYAFSASAGSVSGIIWMNQAGQRGEISGWPGEKYDNSVLYDVDGDGDLDVIQSEQNDNLGVFYHESPNVAPVIDAGVPDASPPDASLPDASSPSIDASEVCGPDCVCVCE